MKKSKRLFTLIRWLEGRGLVRGEEIAEEFEISLRTVYRDVQDLQDLGVPLRGEAGVGYLLTRSSK